MSALDPDTIAAVATPPGSGALAVLRLSGPECAVVLGRVIPSLGGALPFPRSPTLLPIVNPTSGEPLDRGLVTWFPAPASYTGEDSAELSVHGGALVTALVLDACVRGGARVARPGEFTERAYLNGKLDLVQAEAIHDLIRAESEAGHRAAVTQMEGALSRRVAGIRERLVQLEALLSYHVDFPEEDEPPVPRARIVGEGRALVADLEALVRTAPEGELLREGALVVLAGRPNSGKSSLLNALVGEERAIVTAEPGTTRDAIEVKVSLDSFPFRLVDTAGIREGAGEVERLGIEVARRYLANADVVLFCHPCGASWSEAEDAFIEELPERTAIMVLRTMIDRVTATSVRDDRAPTVGRAVAGMIEVSTVDGSGLDALRRTLPALVFEGLARLAAGAPVLTRRRQREAAESALAEVRAFVDALEVGVDAEVAAAHLRGAESALEELIGVISGEDVLDRVFREFCIGK